MLALVVEGNTNRYIAHKLAVKEGTIKRIVSNGYRKLGIASRAELVRYVLCDQQAQLATLYTGRGAFRRPPARLGEIQNTRCCVRRWGAAAAGRRCGHGSEARFPGRPGGHNTRTTAGTAESRSSRVL